MKQHGFSLLEILLSTAMIGIIAAFTLPVYRSTVLENDIDIAVETTVHALRRAQVLAKASYYDGAWGVRVDSGAVSIYRGTDYDADRVVGFEELFEISDTIVISGIDDVSFSVLTGEPSITGEITMTRIDGSVRSIDINQKGVVDY